MFSLFRRRPPENVDDITLDISDEQPVMTQEKQAAAQDTPVESVDAKSEEEDIAISSARRAIDDINAEEIRRGKPYTEEERQVLLLATGKKYAGELLLLRSMTQMTQTLNSATSSNQMDGVSRDLQEISAKVDEPRDAVGRALQFQQEHPFLAGFLGAEIVDRLKKK